MNMHNNDTLKKPEWIRSKIPSSGHFSKITRLLRDGDHVTVCEEASCPNRAECFNHGTATFMIMGAICTRSCKFCNVTHGRPLQLDTNEPIKLARTISKLQLKYVVITSVDRDDLQDKGAQHFANCIKEIRIHNPKVKIEILTPDFRHFQESALYALSHNLPDVFGHNLETVKRLYKEITPSSDYDLSLNLLSLHKKHFPNIPTKSGLMVGLGEKKEEIIEAIKDLREHNVDLLTIGQYLQPSKSHWPVKNFISPEEFIELKEIAKTLGFKNAECGPFVRSSYHAEQQSLYKAE